MKTGRPRTDVVSRIFSRVEQNGDCLLWKGPKTSDGYGSIGIGRSTNKRVHRVVWELSHGEIPKGKLVCHSCDTPLCVNVNHLFLGTPRDNTQDMIRKGRDYRPRGENHPNAKVNDAQVAAIRYWRSQGRTLSAIADSFGISFQRVSALCKGERQCA